MALILVVDDDADARDLLARFLRKAGHNVTVAPNGREAMAALSAETPEVVVVDYRMPEMDGISFVEVIRCYLRWQTLPVILLTAHPEGQHIKRAVELGVRKTFLKGSYQLHDLLSHIESCVPGELARSPHADLPALDPRLN